MEIFSKKIDWLTLTTVRLSLRRLDPQFSGFRLVQVSDIHMGTWIDRRRLDFVVDAVNDLHPDVIAITGDFVSDDPEEHAADLIGGLSRLRAASAAVAVRGNHDYWSGPAAVDRIIRASGLIHLRNRVHSVRRNSAEIHIAGVDCHYVGQARLGTVLDQIPACGSAVLLVHEPDYADVSAQSGRFDLQISGHSHGGQVLLPWIGPAILPRYARRYPMGLYRINGMLQYTNRGIGTAHIKLRLNCPPEITLFELFPENTHALQTSPN